MLLSLGVYWQLYGWKWALGVVASIYVHEMGHVAMLRRYGIDATAPMFIPGFGALIRARFYPNDVIGEARVGLAGPIWGLAAAVVCFTVYSVTGSHAWGAIAVIGAYINLFNLTPVWQLDGAHGFKALTKEQRWIVVLALAAAWFLTREPLLILLLVMAAIAAMNRAAAEQPDRRTLLEFLVLIAALSALAALPISVQSALK